MYRIGVKRGFDAAHRLEGHPGKCSRLHGHSWRVEAVFASEGIGPDGMFLDFDDAGAALERLLEPLDHSCLNELDAFETIPPTAENVARHIYERLSEEFRVDSGVRIEGVTVWESESSWSSYGQSL
jgi:6-pyruvoyltetrahydropterin/6-carboxytetrahydropterin synthase